MAFLRPLCETNPEFLILENPGFCEYRVENLRLCRDGSNRIIRGTSTFTWLDAVILAIIIIFWRKVQDTWALVGLGALSLLCFSLKCTQVLHESVVILPPHGVQFETHRGFPPFCLFTTRRFIRLNVLQDVVISEGLLGWNVRYYLAAIKLVGPSNFRLDVAFQSLLPHHDVLLEVYRDIHATLMSLSD